MIDESQLLSLMSDMESSRVERTVSTTDTAKYCQAICAFSNDMPGTGLPGYLLLGVDDKKGTAIGLTVSDMLLQTLAGFGSDGNTLPAPALTVYKIALSSGAGDVAVVEVQPSDIPPVRFKGQIWIRRGPRKGIANESEERLLSERRTSSVLTYDAQPCVGASLGDLALDLFVTSYRPQAVDAEIIAENGRPLEIQLASLRFFDLGKNAPTHAGILLFGKNPLYYEPHAYVQYVRYEGLTEGSDVLDERQISGDLLNLLRELDLLARSLPTARPHEQSTLSEKLVYDYPPAAIRELLMNAIMHRSYNQASPIRILHFANRIEILSPGPLYGPATSANFPRQTSYRNPIIAEAMKVLGFVNRFGRGVERARSALNGNGSPPPQFEFGDTFFAARIEVRA